MSDSRYNRFESFKALFHIEKLREIAGDKIPFPVEWVVYPTNSCPYNCGHCIMKVERQSYSASLSAEVMNKIPVDAEKFGVKTVIFSGGGDPLMHEMTVDTLQKLKERGISTGLNTNGFFLSDASDVDYLRVSVDAATPETYKKVHGYDGWDTVNENLRNLKRGKELGLAFLVTPDNWREIEDFCNWAQQFEPDFIHIRPAYLGAAYLDGEEALNKLMVVMHDLKEVLEFKFSNVFFRLDKFGYGNNKKYDKCRATPLMAVLTADGSFVVCQDVFKRFGDYNKQSFEDIWLGDDHIKAIESIDIEQCPRCVEKGYNEIIQNCVMEDGLKANLL